MIKKNFYFDVGKLVFCYLNYNLKNLFDFISRWKSIVYSKFGNVGIILEILV